MQEVWIVSKNGYTQIITATKEEAEQWVRHLGGTNINRVYEIQRWTLGLIYGIEK